MAGRLTTTAVSQRKGTGQQVGGDGKATEKFELALAESGGLRAFRADFHMSVIIHTERPNASKSLEMRK